MELSRIDLLRDFSPLFYLMKLFGLYYTQPPNNICTNAESKGKWKFPFRRFKWPKLYVKLVVFITTVNSLRFVFSYNSNDSIGFTLFLKFIFTVFYIKVAINAFICYRASTDPTRLSAFFYHWQHIRVSYSLSMSGNFSNYILIATVITIMLTACNISLIGYAFFNSNVINISLTPYRGTFNFVWDAAYKILILIIKTYTTLAWLYPIVLLLCLCK